MTNLQIFYIGIALFFSGFLFNVAETAYFGWNIKAASKAEMICDYVAFAVMWSGIMFIARCFIND